MMNKAISLSGLVLVGSLLFTSCGVIYGPSRMASVEQQKVIEDEFWKYFPETVENTGTEPSKFVFDGGAVYDANKAKNRGYSGKSSCSNDSDGTTLYQLSVHLTDRNQTNTEAEYKSKIEKMRTKWESEGHQVQSVGPVVAGQEIKFVTDAGITVRYSAGKHAEIISVSSECVLPE